jgi:predicted AAA+ superfamily ATPase
MNPWWRGQPGPLLPLTRRHLVGEIHRRLNLGLAPIVLVRGPRQIGKTTAQLHLT